VKMPESLNDVFEAALHANATDVTFEYDSSGDLEITYYHGSSGIGVAVRGAVKQRIISELVARAGLETRERGTIRVTQNDRVRVVRVSTRDHFGESAFDLRFRV